jgi:hypothetical protein
MNRIKIRRVITPFEKISLYDIFDSRKEELERKIYNWRNGEYKDGKMVYYAKCPVAQEEIEDLHYVDTIYFYPDENKFEVMLKGKLFKTIISKEYSITSFIQEDKDGECEYVHTNETDRGQGDCLP